MGKTHDQVLPCHIFSNLSKLRRMASIEELAGALISQVLYEQFKKAGFLHDLSQEWYARYSQFFAYRTAGNWHYIDWYTE